MQLHYEVYRQIFFERLKEMVPDDLLLLNVGPISEVTDSAERFFRLQFFAEGFCKEQHKRDVEPDDAVAEAYKQISGKFASMPPINEVKKYAMENRDKVLPMCSLIRNEGIDDLLTGRPFYRLADMCIIFTGQMEYEGVKGSVGFNVTNEIMEGWKVNREELMKVVAGKFFGTMQIGSAIITDLPAALKSYFKDDVEIPDISARVFVPAIKGMTSGIMSIVHPGFIPALAKKTESKGYYILPTGLINMSPLLVDVDGNVTVEQCQELLDAINKKEPYSVLSSEVLLFDGKGIKKAV
ncbi:hypothetical protein SAMN06296386_1235 [Lachnospiraceae bacterium]|nr:hypothetical protein SAMN06296386_1235 [Lachnospiraceae bacterium]